MDKFQLAQLATRAVLYEVSCHPSPGLVSPTSSGAHDDMDYFTFLDSSTALFPYFVRFAEAGFSPDDPKAIFKKIRSIGLEAERDMFLATKGINTHKGMLFLMGISCAATAKTHFENRTFHKLPLMIQEMTAQILTEELHTLTSKEELSHGEKLFLQHGLKGVRGEVASGLPTVFLHGLPFYEANADLCQNDRLLQTLFKLISVCEDTTIVHRHSVAVLTQTQDLAIQWLALGGIRTLKGRLMLAQMEKSFIEQRISPGGSADLLAITLFFSWIKNR